MSDKIKSISCLLISVFGWSVFIGGIVYFLFVPYENEFSSLVNFSRLFLFTITGAVIHLVNCVYGMVLLFWKSESKSISMLGFGSSFIFVVFGVALYSYLKFSSSDLEEPRREFDVRWKEYIKEVNPPYKEIQLAQSAFSIIFTQSLNDQKALCASTSGSNIDYIDLVDGRPLFSLDSHQRSVQSLSFSPDGKRAISGGNNGEIILWNLQDGVEIGRKKGHSDYVRSIAYSPVGNQGLSGGDDQEILLWDLDTMQIIKRFGDHALCMGNKGLVWGSDGKTFLSASGGPSIRLWDIETGQERFRLQVKDAMIVSIALSPDGKYVLSSHRNGPEQPVILWDLETEQEVNRFGVPGNPWHADQSLHIESVAFSSDGKTALFGLVFGTVIWWDLSEWKAIRMNRLFNNELTYVYFSKDDRYCIAVGDDDSSTRNKGSIKYWELDGSGINMDKNGRSGQPPPPAQNWAGYSPLAGGELLKCYKMRSLTNE